jgi:hypothetical protein
LTFPHPPPGTRAAAAALWTSANRPYLVAPAAYTGGITVADALRDKFAAIWPHLLDERARRLVAASEARQLGHGGIGRVSRACGLSRVTLTKGVQELDEAPLPAGRGRFRIVSRDPGVLPVLEALVEPLTRGDPASPLSYRPSSLNRRPIGGSSVTSARHTAPT